MIRHPASPVIGINHYDGWFYISLENVIWARYSKQDRKASFGIRNGENVFLFIDEALFIEAMDSYRDYVDQKIESCR